MAHLLEPVGRLSALAAPAQGRLPCRASRRQCRLPRHVLPRCLYLHTPARHATVRGQVTCRPKLKMLHRERNRRRSLRLQMVVMVSLMKLHRKGHHHQTLWWQEVCRTKLRYTEHRRHIC